MKKPTRGVVLSGFYWERLHGKKWRECIRKVKRPKRTEKKRKKEEQLIQQSTSSAGARTRMRGNTRREWINSSNQSGQTLLVLLFSCCCCFCRCRWCRRRCSCLSRVLGGHRGNSLSGRVRERTSFFFSTGFLLGSFSVGRCVVLWSRFILFTFARLLSNALNALTKTDERRTKWDDQLADGRAKRWRIKTNDSIENRLRWNIPRQPRVSLRNRDLKSSFFFVPHTLCFENKDTF